MISLIPSTLLLLAAAVGTTAPAPAHSTTICRASLTVSDARELATQTPNARAFVENLKATLRTEVAGRSGSIVRVRVLNTANNNELVGIYSVNLRTGSVLDDDQEPAEDSQTTAVRTRLIARHCK